MNGLAIDQELFGHSIQASQMPYLDMSSAPGPTGLVFPLPAKNAKATEFNTIVEMDNKYHIIPLLVPGQTDIGALLNKGPNDEHIRNAIGWARKNKSLGLSFNSLKEAQEYENLRHGLLNQLSR